MNFLRKSMYLLFFISVLFLTACTPRPPEKFYSEAFELRDIDGELVVFKGCNQGLKKIRLEDAESNAVTISNGEEIVMRFYPTEVSYAKRIGLYAFDDAQNLTKITAKLLDNDKVIWTVDGVETLYVYRDLASNYRYYAEENCEAINIQSEDTTLTDMWVGKYSLEIDLYGNPETKITVTIDVHKDGSADYLATGPNTNEYIMLNTRVGHDYDYEHNGLLLNVGLQSLGYREPAYDNNSLTGYDIDYSDDFGIIVQKDNSYFLINSVYLEERFVLDRGAEVRLVVNNR